MLDADAAAGALERADEAAEGVEMMQGAGLGDLQPQPRRGLRLLLQAAEQLPAESFVLDASWPRG